MGTEKSNTTLSGLAVLAQKASATWIKATIIVAAVLILAAGIGICFLIVSIIR